MTPSLLDRRDVHVSLRHFRAFEAAGRLGSLNRAGEAVHMSQSAVTYALQQVENLFSVRLMDRDARGSRLTEAGAVVHARLASFLCGLDAAVAAVVRESGGSGQPDLARIVASVSWLHILALVNVQRFGDVEAAVDRLGISPASLRRRLREVELFLSAELVVRTAERSSLNRRGRAFAQSLGLAAKELDYAIDELASLGDRHGSTISLGCLGLARTALIPEVLAQYLADRRAVRVRIIDDSFNVVFPKLCMGDIDYLICARRDEMALHGIVGEELFQASYAIACRRDHPLTRAGVITVADLMRYDWLLPTEGTPLRRACERIFDGSDVPHRSAIETQSATVSFAVVRSSDRLMISSWHDIVSNRQDSLLTILPYDLPVPARTIYLYWREGFRPPPFHAAFAQALRRRAGELGRIFVPRVARTAGGGEDRPGRG